MTERQAWQWLTGDVPLSVMPSTVKIGGRHGAPKQLDPGVIDARKRAAKPHRHDEGADATIAEIEAIPARDRRRIAELAARYGRAAFGAVAAYELAQRSDAR